MFKLRMWTLIAVSCSSLALSLPVHVAAAQSPSSCPTPCPAKEHPEGTPPPTPPGDGYLSKVFKPDVLPVWLGFIGTIFACCVAVYTLSFIKKQTLAFTKQTAIQEAAMRQWVDLGGWSSEEDTPGTGTIVEVTFHLVNPTNFLLTLRHAEIALQNGSTKFFLARDGTPLPPNKPFIVKIPITLTPLKMTTFMDGTLGMVLSGTIVFMGALGKEVTQSFEGLLSCNRTATTFEYTLRDQRGGGTST